MKLVLDEVLNSVFAPLAQSVVLPLAQNQSEPIMVSGLLVEFVKAALLSVLLFLELPNRAFLLVDRLHHHRDLVVTSTGVLIKVILVLLHVSLSHLREGINELLLELCLKSVVGQCKGLDGPRGFDKFDFLANLCDF